MLEVLNVLGVLEGDSLEHLEHIEHLEHPEHLSTSDVPGDLPLHRTVRVLIQRVSRAEVRVREREGAARTAGRIGGGFVLLVGFTHDDDEARLAWMADKIIGLRLFGDSEGKMNLALEEVGGALLVVSQFTLYGDAEKGRRPSFIDAARPDAAERLYERFLAMLAERGVHVERGEFGAMMDVELVNDGPVTLWLER